MAPLPDFTANEISSSGRTSEKLNLTTLQSIMKVDPEGYSSELVLVYNQFKSSLDLFQQQAALNFTSLSGIAADSSVAKDLGDRAMFLAHVTPFYPKELTQFPTELVRFLESSARNLPSGLRVQVTQALILLVNRKVIFFLFFFFCYGLMQCPLGDLCEISMITALWQFLWNCIISCVVSLWWMFS